MKHEASIRDPLIIGDKSLHDISVDIAKPIETSANKWWWALFIVLTNTALFIVDMIIGDGVLNGLFMFATVIPGLALSARRLHDINKSGWWLLMWLICWLIIPLIVLLVWAAKHGDNEPNKYGANPQKDTRHLVPDQILACEKCQSEVDNHSKFCPQCGTQIFQK